MKKKIMYAVACVALAAIAGWNQKGFKVFNTSSLNNNSYSEYL